VRSQPWASADATAERWRERAGGYPEAAGWLGAAQDAAGDGFARGYSLYWNPYFGARGWQPAYPETTGYIVPTLYQLADHLGRPEFSERAERAARWEIAIQLPSGAVRGGVIGEVPSPAVFNTGQVILGWLVAFERTGASAYADAARRAGRFLVEALGSDGFWRKGHSEYAMAGAALYNARTAWALAEAGVRLGEPAFLATAHRHHRAVAAMQLANGWFPECCLSDASRPLLHTLAYTVRGMLEGGRVHQDDALLASSRRAAAALAAAAREDGWMAGRFDRDWRPAAAWSCLTGEAQMANNWMRLFHITGERSWLDPVSRVLGFVKRTQNRSSGNAGLRGGIKGSSPVSGEYGRYEVLNWATKFFTDALVRAERIAADPETAGRLDAVLA
jgi:uncharacterized protein YyaL (SSP411 family)